VGGDGGEWNDLTIRTFNLVSVTCLVCGDGVYWMISYRFWRHKCGRFASSG